jgi:hypothetical protein
MSRDHLRGDKLHRMADTRRIRNPSWSLQLPVKKLIGIICVVALLCSCATFSNYFSDNTIVSAVTVATSSGLRYGIKDAARRTVIANYIDVVAAVAVRATSGTPSPGDLSAAITNAIPSSVKANYPEIVAFVVPVIVSNYEIAYMKFGPNAAKLYAVLSDIATGLESGAAPYITK